MYNNYNDVDNADDEVDFNFEDVDDDNDNDTYNSLFANYNNKALVVIDNKELLRRRLDENLMTKNHELRLTGKFVDHLPEELKEFTWVTTLFLETTDLKSINDNLPPNIKKFICKFNKIRIFDASVLPTSVISIVHQNNDTMELVGLNEGLIEIDVSSNALKEISCPIPSTTVKLAISGNKIFMKLPDLPDSVRDFLANDTSIHNIDSLNDNVQCLSTCRCNIQFVNKLPANLKEWKSFVSQIEEIRCTLPIGMTHLDLFNNSLIRIPPFPESMVDVDLSNNSLEEIPEFKSNLEKIDLKQNSQIEMNDIQRLRAEMPNVNILYEPSRSSITYSDVDYFGGEYAQGRSNNYGTQSYGTQSYGTQSYGTQSYGTQSYCTQYKPKNTYKFISEFVETNPDVVILNKTYLL
jgi:hypothetical protein